MGKAYALLAMILLMSPPAMAETLFTQTEGGTVSLVQHLTPRECKAALEKVQDNSPFFWNQACIRNARNPDECSGSQGFFSASAGTIKIVECLK